MQDIVVKEYKNLDAGEKLNQDVETYIESKMSWASKEESHLFFSVASSRRLNPLANQIHAVPRKKKINNQYVTVMEIQTGIDGLRLIAQRSNDYSGQVGPYWCGDDGKWTDVWLKNTPPKAAKVGVLRSTFKEPLYSIALWDAYAQSSYDGKLTHIWQKMGVSQLAKCAEALALRKAFPEDMGGLYSDDEMGQAEDKEPKEVGPTNSQKSTTTQPQTNQTKPPQMWIQNEADLSQSRMNVGPHKGKTFSEIGGDILCVYLSDVIAKMKTPPQELNELLEAALYFQEQSMKTPQNGDLSEPALDQTEQIPF